MTQVEFGHVATLPDGNNMFLTGVTDMVVAQTGVGPVLYTVSRLGGDLLAYRIGADEALALIDSQSMPGGVRVGVETDLVLVGNGGGLSAYLGVRDRSHAYGQSRENPNKLTIG